VVRPRLRLQLGYGSTELGPMASMHDDPDEEAIARGEYGRPVPLAELRSIDDDGTPLPPAQRVRSRFAVRPSTLGYWGQGEEGRTDDGWFSIGDVGFVDGSGFVHITGRLVERVPVRRENIYPARLRRLSWTCPGSWSWPWWGCRIRRGARSGCWLSCPGPGSPSPLTPSAGMPKASWPGFKIPRHLRVVDRLPRSATEKVARAELRASFTTVPADW